MPLREIDGHTVVIENLVTLKLPEGWMEAWREARLAYYNLNSLRKLARSHLLEMGALLPPDLNRLNQDMDQAIAEYEVLDKDLLGPEHAATDYADVPLRMRRPEVDEGLSGEAMVANTEKMLLLRAKLDRLRRDTYDAMGNWLTEVVTSFHEEDEELTPIQLSILMGVRKRLATRSLSDDRIDTYEVTHADPKEREVLKLPRYLKVRNRQSNAEAAGDVFTILYEGLPTLFLARRQLVHERAIAKHVQTQTVVSKQIRALTWVVVGLTVVNIAAVVLSFLL